MPSANLTERQRKWFASVREGLERDTGKSLAEWVEIARTCPETKHRARLKWFKETHGLLQNRASQVLGEAYPSAKGWSEPDTLIDTLWADPRCREVYEALDTQALALEGALRTVRKGYVAWSRRVQFAAARPMKDGSVMLGLAVPADTGPGLRPRGSESWSERLGAKLLLPSANPGYPEIGLLLRSAWEAS